MFLWGSAQPGAKLGDLGDIILVEWRRIWRCESVDSKKEGKETKLNIFIVLGVLLPGLPGQGSDRVMDLPDTDAGSVTNTFPYVTVCTLLGMPLWERVNEEKNQELLSRWSPHTSDRFLPKHTRPMAGWPVPKVPQEGLPKSVLQSPVTLYMGRSFLASNLNLYPSMPPASPQPTWSVEWERNSQTWREASVSDKYLINICGRCAMMVWFYAWVMYVAGSINSVQKLFYSYTINKSLRSFLSPLNHC